MTTNNILLAGGGTATIVGGDVHHHGQGSDLDRLASQVAAGALHNSSDVYDQPKCHPGTRVAILDYLVTWAEALRYEYPIKWLHGPAGAGKSAIQRTVAQLLFERGLLIASFFFFRSALGRNSSDRFIATIAYQLALSIPATRPYIEKALERNPLVFSLSIWDQAQNLIVSPLLSAYADPSFDSTQSPRIIIIDGLDECRDADKQCVILQVLARTLQILPIPLAVIVASRPEHHIRDTFDSSDLNQFSSRMALDNSHNPDADIQRYLIDKFDAIKAKHHISLSSPWPSQQVIDKLVAKASGQFIYVSTVDKFVSSIKHNPLKRLDMILGTIDAGTLKPFEQLDNLYSVIFNTIDSEEIATTLRVLGVLLVRHAEPPTDMYPVQYLSPRYLEDLLELEAGDVRRSLLDLESLLTVCEDHIRIRFFHASLSDHLFDKSRSSQFWINQGLVYADLAEQCFVHLSKSADSPGLADVQYACWSNCTLYLSKATPTSRLRECVENCVMRQREMLKFSNQRWYFKSPAKSSAFMITDFTPTLLLAIRKSTFHGAHGFYLTQLAAYAQIIRPRIEFYFSSTPLKNFLITAATTNIAFAFKELDNLGIIFNISPAMREGDEARGFHLLYNPRADILGDPAFMQVIGQLLCDPKGRYFVSQKYSADIALYLIKCMSPGLQSHVPANCQASKYDERASASASDIRKTMGIILPGHLSRSAIRRDLVQCLKKTILCSCYLEDTQNGINDIQRAINTYISTYNQASTSGRKREIRTPTRKENASSKDGIGPGNIKEAKSSFSKVSSVESPRIGKSNSSKTLLKPVAKPTHDARRLGSGVPLRGASPNPSTQIGYNARASISVSGSCEGTPQYLDRDQRQAGTSQNLVVPTRSRTPSDRSRSRGSASGTPIRRATPSASSADAESPRVKATPTRTSVARVTPAIKQTDSLAQGSAESTVVKSRPNRQTGHWK